MIIKKEIVPNSLPGGLPYFFSADIWSKKGQQGKDECAPECLTWLEISLLLACIFGRIWPSWAYMVWGWRWNIWKAYVAPVGRLTANKAAAKRVESDLPNTFPLREGAVGFGFDTPSPCDIVLQAQGRGIGTSGGSLLSLDLPLSAHQGSEWGERLGQVKVETPIRPGKSGITNSRTSKSGNTN